MIEFQEGDYTYRTGSMDVFEQFHVARKISPILGSLLALVKSLTDPEDIMVPLTEALAKMSDADTEYVLFTCAKYVSRKGPSGEWVKIFSPEAKRFMFSDINLRNMIFITAKMVMDNLGNFFPELQLASPEPVSASPSTQ